jgi:hypothetical protein
MEAISLVKDDLFSNLAEFFKMFSTRYVHSGGCHFVFSDIAFPFNNICLIPDDSLLAPAAVDNIIQQYAASHTKSFCIFTQSEKLPDQLESYLEAKSFAKSSSFSGLIKKLNHEQYNFELPVNNKIVIVDNPRQLNDWMVPFKIGFGYSDDAAATLLKHLIKSFTNTNIKHFLLFHHTQPIGCASLFFDGTTAGFYNLTVIPEFRDSGLGLMLQKARLNFAVERKCKMALMQAAAISEHMARKLGFSKVTNFIPFIYTFK